MSNLNEVMKISDIAKIRTGFTFREKIEEVESGSAHIVQIKDVRTIWTNTWSHTLYSEDLPKIRWEGKDNASVAANCVLLPCRGEFLQASYFVGSKNSSSRLPVIVSSQFLVIFPKENVLPEYLCWYLNQPNVQHRLRYESQGSSMPMLSIGSISQFLIEVPNLEIQQSIIKLNRLWEQEQVLAHKLLTNREQLMQGIFQKLLQGNK
ncbi:restriction endonuclease subunit S [Acinetobacter pseudolwoffii]|jgi:hypothetical protein|uniref:restriction endonuclease subunit S n=1 Tax=Acinetobacter pseudolwoffii TaxID=2053287 RepID=UPI003988CAC5